MAAETPPYSMASIIKKNKAKNDNKNISKIRKRKREKPS